MNQNCSGLEITGISKIFNTVQVLRDFSLRVNTGEVLTIMGPSGGGKTTLLRLIAGLETPDRGKISYQGQLWTSPEWLLPPWERKISMVFQGDALFPHLSVEEQLSLGTREKSPKRNDILNGLNVSPLLDRRPHQLSGGEIRRISLARALLETPKLFLFDEPFAHLDEPAQKDISEFLRSFLASAGITAIIVTHETVLAQSLGFPIKNWKNLTGWTG